MMLPTLQYRTLFRLLLPGVILLLLQCGVVRNAMAAQQVSEYHIKAVFLTNLTHFVTWPEEKGRSADSPFIIGILGPDPFQSIIDKAVAGETKNGRPINVKRYSTIEELPLDTCAILFIHTSQIEKWPQISTILAHAPILTVADAAGFPEQGGMVNLVKTGQKIQVEINRKAVQRSGLSISSKLLTLARIVQ